MDRYYYVYNSGMTKLDKDQEVHEQVYIKEEDVNFMKKQLEDIEDCLVSGEGSGSIRLIIERPKRYYDMNGREIVEGDIVSIAGVGVYGVDDDGGIFNLGNGNTIYAFLKDNFKNIKVVGKVI